MTSTKKEFSIKSIKRETLSQQVLDQIVDLLITGQLKPGDKLPTEAELINKFIVSRPVLRAALSSLETMGLIQKKTREGTFFSNKIGSKPFSNMLALSVGDLPSIVEARMALELGLVTMAAEKITDEQLEQLEKCLELMSLNPDNYILIDSEFHRIIAYSANNSALEGIIDPLLEMVDETLSQIPFTDRNHTVTLQQHHDIFEALRKRDPITAYTRMYHHLNSVREKMNRKITERESTV